MCSTRSRKFSMKPKFLVLILLFFYCFLETDAWHRRRSCSRRNCVVSSWSSWSSCSAEKCGQQGSQRRTRRQISGPSCGGAECPNMNETRRCYGRSVNCQLSSWSQWSSCSTPCGVSGIETRTRHKIIPERCGGTCSSILRIRRSCLESCRSDGGSFNPSVKKPKDKSKGKISTKLTIGRIAGFAVGGLVALIVVVYVIYACATGGSCGEVLELVCCLCRCLIIGG